MSKLAVLPRIAVILGLAALPGVGLAQAAAAPELSEIEVLAKRVNARNRVDTAAPTLSYDEEYFQRFEPLSVGDMMKRVPGVSFQSDIGEYAEPSLRGIGSEYTQILVNGRRVTGGTNDNTVVVDRIPAELVERVEIIRSPSSDIDSQGVGGTLNIILKEGAELSGGIYRLGAYYNDGETNPSAFLSLGDTHDNVEWGTSFNFQERFNRKTASEMERALDGEGGVEPAFSAVVEDPDERESTDIAWTGDVRVQLAEEREWFAGAFYMDTDRAETEVGREFAAEEEDGEVEAEAGQFNQLDAFNETNYGLFTGFETAFGSGHTWQAEIGYDQTEFESVETNWEDDLDFDFDAAGMTDADGILAFLDQSDQDIIDFFAVVPNDAINLRDPELLASRENTDADDSEFKIRSSVEYQLSGSKLKIGLELIDKQRDFSFRAFENEDGVLEEDDAGLSLFDAKDQRANGYVKWNTDLGNGMNLELGGRGEFTSLDLDSTVSEALAEAAPQLAAIGILIDGNQIESTEDFFEFNPSAHLRWDVTDRTQLRLSAARTIRRPNFDQLNPTLIIDDEESILGNPGLDQETAIGFDAGFDVELDGNQAIFGINGFYRIISDKIELDGVPDGVNEIFQEFVDEDIEATVWVNNPNEGKIWGVELDFSSPLPFIDPNFHVFANYTWIDSEIQDANVNFPVDRRFSLQPDYIYNVGFDHLIEAIGFTWGASYQKQGPAEEWVNLSAEAKEVTEVEFDGSLEFFVEKTIAERYVVRLAAQNLLDASKDELQRVYESVDQLVANTPVSSLRAAEESDPVYILTFRGTF
ncbi:MAG: TonB-dependent receptor plug domain-containing protein [Steroidobacteraceae bacterium]